MDKNWMLLNDKLCDEFEMGVKSFIEEARKHVNKDQETRCPCRRCINANFHPLDVIESHLFRWHIARSYKTWIYHGEEANGSKSPPNASHVNDAIGDKSATEEDEDDEMIEIINDICGSISMDGGQSESADGCEPVDGCDGGNMQQGVFEKFATLLAEAKKRLHPGCTDFSSLEFLVKLMHIKVLNHLSNKCFDMLLKLLRQAFPEARLPDSNYEAKRMLRDLGLGYESIHACKYDCALFWKEHEEKEHCPVCGEPRYKFNDGKGKKIPHKILRYFPLIPRLQRLFSSKHTASDMRWHKDKRVETEGDLRHVADAEAWKDFDHRYSWFANEPRNVRLGLATDGFNPFANMSNSYSMWPVILMPYNLPPWKCMKEPFFMMSLLIPGPQAPGKDIDVYLRPLIDELKELWNTGVQTFDASKGESFQMHAAVLFTINDFPAYANLSGWSTKGYLACPVCNQDASSLRLRNKICYMGHRRYLPHDHTWRRSKLHDGKYENRDAPVNLTGDDILLQLEHVCSVKPGKNPNNQDRKRKRNPEELNWTRKSIFFELPYWASLRIRHKLDVMHTEKNICDNIMGTLMSMEGKTKDTDKARLDLADMNIRKELHLQLRGDKYVKPQACYTLTPEQRKDFCKFLKSVKYPDGYAANISRSASIDEGKISGLKSHDCHVLLQRILPIGIRAYLRKDICTALVELCSFVHDLCAKSLTVDHLDKLEEGIVLILCKLERIFPPAFFDVMVHLAVHLPREAKLVGPVGYSWMYPIERSLGTLKRYVKNKARPEGSIAEAYIVNESLTYCSMYLRGIETKFNRDERNDDKSRDNHRKGVISVFSQNVRPTGGKKRKRLSVEEREHVTWYVLNNCEELQPYLDDHMKELQKENNVDLLRRQQKEFPKWFRERMTSLRFKNSPEATDELYSLAWGPEIHMHSYSGCIVNGVRFHTKDVESRRTTQNSGVVVDGEHEGDTVEFYGILSKVIVLSYMFRYQVVLFKCEWFDVNPKKKRVRKDYNFTCINVNKKWYENDPFVLATQAQQVFYVNDHKFGENWKVVQKIKHRHIWDVAETEEVDELHMNTAEAAVNDTYQHNGASTVLGTVEEDDMQARELIRQDAEPETVNEDVEHSDDDFSDDFMEEDETLYDYNDNNHGEEIKESDYDTDID